MIPLLRREGPALDPFEAFRRAYRPGEGAVFLDSCPEAAVTPAERALRRFSFVAVAPSKVLRVEAGSAQGALGQAQRFVADDPVAPDPVTPFPCGVAGLFTYDAARLFERIPATASADVGLPWVHLARFEAVLTFDHVTGRSHLTARDNASGRAALALLAGRLAGPASVLGSARTGPLSPGLSPEAFEAMVRAGKSYVHEGHVYQANLSHRFRAPFEGDPLALYALLRKANPAPFAAFYASGRPDRDPEAELFILSSSPERLFEQRGRDLEARPIAGTRPRGRTPAEDAALARELASDVKERAEHTMLVDLARNDLGRVSEYGSVRVEQLLAVESYRRVHHLVSSVRSRLRDGLGPLDAFAALFPGGTITGVPKVRAMEIIDEIEPVRRGAYTGGLGYFSATGDAADWNILIRTLVLHDGVADLQVGAGIVQDSVPSREYDETLAKAQALREALEAALSREAIAP